ncbi:MAG: response regulator [Nonlabens sp.]|uniref:response regulator n=1 Tax=Nonlabens sp. TaxID=1888209 RepID=UPI003EF33A5D
MKEPQIWIVDDNPVDSYVIKTMFEVNELSHDIQVFSTNEEALKKLDDLKNEDFNNSIHIITENKTTTVDGWNLVEEMSRKNKSLKFHLSSENYNAQDLRKFKNTAAVHSLNVKPLRLDDLKSIIEH